MYEKMYLILFHAISNALWLLERDLYETAITCLITGQQRAETCYMEAEEEE